MARVSDRHEALEQAEALAERLIECHGLDRDNFEHDLFYGNPNLALTDIFLEMKTRGLKMPRAEFDRAFVWIGRLQGNDLTVIERAKLEEIAL